MTEKKGITISKSKSYAKHTISLKLDKVRTDKFNKGGKITVTKEELGAIGEHRWLERSLNNG